MKLMKFMPFFLLFTMLITSCNNEDTSDSTSVVDVVKDQYTFTYDLNYEGSTPRVVNVKNGRRANNWNASRAGYELNGWYLESTCENPYDFQQIVTRDTTVYAKWLKLAEKVEVTFNFNYSGAGENAVIKVDEGSTISSSIIPECPRLGFVYDGWYKDASLQNKWNFQTDVVDSPITLYAKYKYNPLLPRDRDGNIEFEDVRVNVWVGANFGLLTSIKALANKFNKENLGKIEVNVTTDLLQDSHSLRIQQTPSVNATYKTYYKVSDIYDLVGIDWARDDWYYNASRENFIDGDLYSVPLVAGVPHLIYNKQLMEKYNTLDHLPTEHEEFMSLIERAVEGERTTNPSFNGVVTNNSWTYREATAATSFIQNDADYYVYKDGAYVNEWENDEYANAKTALNNYYDVLSMNGRAKANAGIQPSEYEDTTAINSVNAKNALFGFINFPNAATKIASSNLGVMPLSGLFASADKEQYKQIPIHQISIEFYKLAKNVPLIEIAAGALFADYLSKNSYTFASSGWYPLRKSAIAESDFNTSVAPVIKLLRSIGDPEDFRTFDGSINEKSIFNATMAETYLSTIYAMEDKSSLASLVESMEIAIVGQL